MKLLLLESEELTAKRIKASFVLGTGIRQGGVCMCACLCVCVYGLFQDTLFSYCNLWYSWLVVMVVKEKVSFAFLIIAPTNIHCPMTMCFFIAQLFVYIPLGDSLINGYSKLSEARNNI